MENVEQYVELMTNFIVNYGMKLIGAAVALIIGLWIIGIIMSRFKVVMTKREVDPSLVPFLISILGMSMRVALIISVAGMVGIEMTSFIAILGAAGLAIGLALQGTLQNFAGGVMLLLFKPFKVGDVLSAQGFTGSVKEIQIFVTIINTPENKTVIIPNGAISNGNITNYTVEGLIRVDMTFGISYDSDIKKAKEVLLDIMQKHPKTLKNPAPFVGVSALADSSVNLAVRPYTHPNDY